MINLILITRISQFPRFVDETKYEWKNNIRSSISSNQSLKNFLSQLSSTEKSLKEVIKKLDDEIEELEDKLKTLKVKRDEAHEKLDVLMESKEKIILSTRFLNNFIDKLPPLPLSSFLPSSSPINNLQNRINDFFEENNLSNFLLGLVVPNKENPIYHYPYNKYSRNYINEINQLISSNQLTSRNLICSFPFSEPFSRSSLIDNYYLSISSKLNIIAINSTREIILFDLQGNNRRSIPINNNNNNANSGIAIIGSLNEIAISDYNNNNIGFYDLTNLKKKYIIGDGILNKPMGISFCPQNGLLAVYNSGGEVLLFRLDDKNSSWKFHSTLPFNFNNNNNKNKNNKNNNNNNNNNEKEFTLTTLFVSNIPLTFDDKKLKKIFNGFNVKGAHTVSRNGRCKGYGFVDFATEDDAKAALKAKHKFKIEEREINVSNAFKYDESVCESVTQKFINQICISSNHLIVGEENSFHIFSIVSENNDVIIQYSINRSDYGWNCVAIHPNGNYWIACSDTSLYFITFTGLIIFTFTPTSEVVKAKNKLRRRNIQQEEYQIEPSCTVNMFNNIRGIAVDGDDDLISLFDSSDRKFFIIRSPLFNGNLYNENEYEDLESSD